MPRLPACAPSQQAYAKRMKKNWVLPLAFMLVFALSRIPGILPPGCSAAYALFFCAGVYFGRWTAWWLPFAVMVITDLGLDFYYKYHSGFDVFNGAAVTYQLINYVVYGLLIWLGRRFKPQSSFVGLLGGGILGAILFYVITNTASWLFNFSNAPEYTRDFIGWITALTKGINGFPPTWEFFRNTLLGGGLFTGLFVGAMKMSEAAESKREKETEEEKEEEPEGEPEPGEAGT